jgi:hypothetical protein
MPSANQLKSSSRSFLTRKPSSIQSPLVDHGVSSRVVNELITSGHHDKIVKSLRDKGPKGQHTTAVLILPEINQIRSFVCHGWTVVRSSHSPVMVMLGQTDAVLQYLVNIYGCLETGELGLNECVAWINGIRKSIIDRALSNNNLNNVSELDKVNVDLLSPTLIRFLSGLANFYLRVHSLVKDGDKEDVDIFLSKSTGRITTHDTYTDEMIPHKLRASNPVFTNWIFTPFSVNDGKTNVVDDREIFKNFLILIEALATYRSKTNKDGRQERLPDFEALVKIAKT